MLLVNRLLRHTQFRRDLRPRPPKFTCSVHVQGLQLFGQPSKGGNGAESNGWVLAPCDVCQVERGHVVKLPCLIIGVKSA